MLHRDFIMIQIEELGKILAQVLFNRNASQGARTNMGLIQTIYSSLKVDKEFLLNSPLHEIREMMNQKDSCGLQRMEIAAKTLLEESYLSPEPNKTQIRNRAKELLIYVQQNDSTFSLEREALIAGIVNDPEDCIHPQRNAHHQ